MKSVVQPQRAREFARQIVQQLQQAGFQALWAGGCVRDELMRRQPKDYDVATNARPDEVRALFGRRRTLALGAAFGVIGVFGPPNAGQIEIATFRAEGEYTDGRHPDRVEFTDARADAGRRDFTINGLFLNPLTGEVYDFVGGQEDIRRRIVRAIGVPDERFGEDKLRMLRAVRFATTLAFTLDPVTGDAVRRHAPEIHRVSGERIAEEMRRILVHPSRRRGVELLMETGLLVQLIPACLDVFSAGGVMYDARAWQSTCELLDRLVRPTFSVALAALIRELYHSPRVGPGLLETVAESWRLSRWEIEGVLRCLAREELLRDAKRRSWPEIQRVLVAPRVDEVLEFAESVAETTGEGIADVCYCREKLALPPSELNPPPLVTGDDLRDLRIPGGPVYRSILDRVRDDQLEGRVSTREEAIDAVERLWKASILPEA